MAPGNRPQGHQGKRLNTINKKLMWKKLWTPSISADGRKELLTATHKINIVAVVTIPP